MRTPAVSDIIALGFYIAGSLCFLAGSLVLLWARLT